MLVDSFNTTTLNKDSTTFVCFPESYVFSHCYNSFILKFIFEVSLPAC